MVEMEEWKVKNAGVLIRRNGCHAFGEAKYAAPNVDLPTFAALNKLECRPGA